MHKFKDLNPADGIGREKMAKSLDILTSFIEQDPYEKPHVWLLLKTARNYETLNITNEKFLKVPSLPFHSGHF
jgi:hypothetical protein